ncbi:penicillin-binding protein 2A [Bacillus ectoiniformans]|uniref:transglycosylase domain-containing protein n=1 Tax=Bacillus ectoiniformans TaxID=1494429 RepID=UPI0019567823|nr:PBP1A family penicillin-binding protein [Bacillus ectoiniformans]MBM7647644.1 penicillin-binding protein 2A [Bacillus ectoiniformans]
MNAVSRFFKNMWRKFHLTQIIILMVSIVVLLGLGFIVYFMKSADVESLQKGLAQPTILYADDGEVASKLSANRSESVSIEKMPENLQHAVVSIEDNRFYEHNGFDLKGMTRAFFKNTVSGGVVQGGSTITQQLTKNAMLSPEKTYKRKIEELFLAIEIEKVYKKDEVLEMYLNTIYFGSGSWGVQNASKKYFGKEVEDLTLSESAMLAGIIKAPSALSPYNNLDKSIARRNVVLNQMVKYGYITEAEASEAKQEEPELKDRSGDPLKGKYPHYADSVINEAIKRYGLTQDELLTKGYKIYTAMDQQVQSGLEEVYKKERIFPKSVNGEDSQSAAILLDPKTGGVTAIVGRRGDHVFRGFNYATQMTRSPGSTIKPLVTFMPALEEGYKPTSMLKDEPTKFGEYEPQNYSKTYEGEVPMYRAVEKSLNVPTVWLLNEIGISKGLDALKRLGIPTEDEDRNLSLALGGMHKGVSPKQMAEAYTTFANDGVRRESYFIKKIIGPDGEVKPKWEPKEVEVTSKEVSDEMTSMLLRVVEKGSGKKAKTSGVDIAGKTGSTQVDGTRGTKDQWFIGYTPTLVGAVWVGVEKADESHHLTTNSSDGAVPVFKEVIEEVLPHLDDTSFDVDSINEEQQPAEESKKDWFDNLVDKWNEIF